MSHQELDILSTGLVSAVGLDAPSSCAALRAKVTNPVQSRFIDFDGEWIMAHEVPHEGRRQGIPRLASFAALAIEEALQALPRADWSGVPVLLCIAEPKRPGRIDGLDAHLMDAIGQELELRLDSRSTTVPCGRIGAAVALERARTMIHHEGLAHVLVAATDSLLSWPTLSHYERQRRLLTSTNSNGFVPGEGAGAILLAPRRTGPGLACSGVGFGREPAPFDSEAPLRADGLVQAVRSALADAGCDMHDIDFRITDISGEHYYFKEASLALSRTLHRPKPEFDLWQPAECLGELGAVAGLSMLVLADAACRKGFSKGDAILVHMSNDDGQRAALTLHYRSA